MVFLRRVGPPVSRPLFAGCPLVTRWITVGAVNFVARRFSVGEALGVDLVPASDLGRILTPIPLPRAPSTRMYIVVAGLSGSVHSGVGLLG